jgi:hypothetical protein
MAKLVSDRFSALVARLSNIAFHHAVRMAFLFVFTHLETNRADVKNSLVFHLVILLAGGLP